MLNDDMLPPVAELIMPTLEALRELGGSARKADVSKIVSAKAKLTQEQLNSRFPSGRASRFDNRMNDVRLYLLQEELIEHPRAGTWQLTENGWSTDPDHSELKNPEKTHRRKRRAKRQPTATANEYQTQPDSSPIFSLEDLVKNHSNWREQLFNLLHQMSWQQLERFFLRIFKSEGIDKIDVVNSSGNTEITGTMTSGGFLTFRVAFKFIRGSRQVGAMDAENFRREVQVGGADKGLFMTTGTFTQEARREAARRNAPKIELIDGEEFVEKLQELGLGIKREIVQVERVTIDPDFFANI